MNKNCFVLCVLAAALASTTAYSVTINVDDLAWWGNTDGVAEPVQDATRSGQWWWPSMHEKEKKDQELWGNRGIIYAQWQKQEELPTPVTPIAAPKASPAPDVLEEGQAAAPKTRQIVWPTRDNPQLTIGGVTYNLGDMLHFDLDSVTLRREDKVMLDHLAEVLKTSPEEQVVIEGHCCDLGTEPYNMGLGMRRAEVVKNYLIQKGIAAERIKTVSYGESKPQNTNSTEEERAKNRRADPFGEMK